MLTEVHKRFQYSHMPFLFRDQEGSRILLYTSIDSCEQNGCWKLHYCVGDEAPRRLETGFSHNVVECSPTAWVDETGFHVSFVAGGGVGDAYRLYRMDGVSLDTLSAPVSMRLARTGFVYKDRLAIGELQDLVHVHDANGDHKIEIPGAFIYRVSYRSDAPDKILISGDWIGEKADVFCIEYDLSNDSQRFIECDGLPAYKCSIFENDVLYAKRTGNSFEDRCIVHGVDSGGIPCKIARRIADGVAQSGIRISKSCGCRLNAREKREQNPTVRVSCLECVEKHLGAAAVILSEIHNGYEYRLRFVGHLHEAEEESQEFSTLHEMIRQARKAYQLNETVPNWESLAVEVQNAR